MTESLNLRAFSYQQPPAPAGPTPGTPPPAPPAWVQFAPFIIIIALFYFLLIRPQRRQQKEREKLIAAIKPNDHVITNGGICGVVARIKDNDVYLRIDEKSDVKIRVLRSAIAVVEKVSGSEERVEKK